MKSCYAVLTLMWLTVFCSLNTNVSASLVTSPTTPFANDITRKDPILDDSINYLTSIDIFYISSSSENRYQRYPFTDDELAVGFTAIDSLAIMVKVDTSVNLPRDTRIEILYEENISLSSSLCSFYDTCSTTSHTYPKVIGTRYCRLIEGGVFEVSEFDIVSNRRYGSCLFGLNYYAFSAYLIDSNGQVIERKSVTFNLD